MALAYLWPLTCQQMVQIYRKQSGDIVPPDISSIKKTAISLLDILALRISYPKIAPQFPIYSFV